MWVRNENGKNEINRSKLWKIYLMKCKQFKNKRKKTQCKQAILLNKSLLYWTSNYDCPMVFFSLALEVKYRYKYV